MAIERTYIMLKPDCIQRGLMGEVISRIERKGYKIVDAKMMKLDEAILREHYAHIADKPFGEGGFGYDPIFVCDELNKTYAEMSQEEKNKVSHRGKALKKLLTYLKINGKAK